MKLIAILLVLGLERFLSLGQYLKRFSWFEGYLDKLQPTLEKTAGWGKPLQLALVILPLPLIVALIMWLLGFVVYDVMGFIVSVFVLLYCLGPDDLFEQVHRYTTACESLDLEEVKQTGMQIHGAEHANASATSEEGESNHRNIAEAIFVQSNDRYFAVLFWFILLGPFGAIVYRMVSLLSRQKANSLAGAAETFRRVLDWVPVRLVTFCYLLMGQFVSGIGAWWDRFLDGLNSNDEILMTGGFASTGLPAEEDAVLEPADITKALQLVERALYVWVVVIALVTLGAWLF